MRKALRLLVKGGTLVYATCSILPEENDGVVQTALENGAELVPMNASWLDALPRLPSMDGTLCIQPTALYEGFYTAVLRKK